MVPLLCGPKQPKIQTEVLGHSLVCSLSRLHRSLVCLLRTTCFACALHCAHSLAHFAHSLARGTVNDLMAIYSVFFSILAHSAPSPILLPPNGTTWNFLLCRSFHSRAFVFQNIVRQPNLGSEIFSFFFLLKIVFFSFDLNARQKRNAFLPNFRFIGIFGKMLQPFRCI